MISFDGGAGGTAGAAVPYMPVNQVAIDEDDPSNVIALLCVCEGNHPLGNVIKLRPPDWSWKQE
jgi:hypothetical protein